MPTPTPVPPTSTSTTTSVPTATPTSSDSSDPVAMVAGDIACDPRDPNYNGGTGTGIACMQLATSNELTPAVAVLPLGDEQYNSGTLSTFQQVYDPTWGRFKSTTYPAVGNHEYETSGAAGYYTYFGSAASPQDTDCTAKCKGYYSYDLGAWHVIVLNSECDQVGGCDAGSPQEQWLKADLAAHATVCTLAYWHRPLFTSGISLGDAAMHDVWTDLYNAHADLVLNGHDHIYERFAPQDPSGNADPTNGITEIIVGTGGVNHDSFSSTAAHSVVRDNTTYGVLKLTLHPTSFTWQFLPETASGNGTFTDAGSRACHE
jgi:acid phosphatase type 7